MSHSVKITLIADQEIELLGQTVNIHDLRTLTLNEHGGILDFHEEIASQPGVEADAELTCDQCGNKETPPYDEGDKCYCGGVFRPA